MGITFKKIKLFFHSFHLQLLAAMSAKLDVDLRLEQDDMEGVSEDEWVSRKKYNAFLGLIELLYLLQCVERYCFNYLANL